MLKALLIERFHLVAHTYALVGPGVMTSSCRSSETGPLIARRFAPPEVMCHRHARSPTSPWPLVRDARRIGLLRGGRREHGELRQITWFGPERPVTDHTELKGDFEITLRWNPDLAGGDLCDSVSRCVVIELLVLGHVRVGVHARGRESLFHRPRAHPAHQIHLRTRLIVGT